MTLEIKTNEPHIHLSMVIDGATFSAQGPKSEVLRLYAEWKELSGLSESASTKPAFNMPRLASQHGR